MSTPNMTPKDLIALFAAKAGAPSPETSQALVRHLECKESLALARFVYEAMDRYTGNNSQPLPAPAELLTPLA
jgi:hypothetical protein